LREEDLDRQAQALARRLNAAAGRRMDYPRKQVVEAPEAVVVVEMEELSAGHTPALFTDRNEMLELEHLRRLYGGGNPLADGMLLALAVSDEAPAALAAEGSPVMLTAEGFYDLHQIPGNEEKLTEEMLELDALRRLYAPPTPGGLG